MSSKSKEIFNETVVGLFMVGIFALLVFFTIVISGVDILSGRRREALSVLFPNVGGLRQHDNVIVRGMPVGVVKDLKLVPEGVRVTLSVDQGVTVREKYHVRVVANSLLGGNALTINEGTGEPLPRTVELLGEPPSDWMQDLGETLAELRKIVGDEDLLGNLRKASASLAAVTERLEKGEGTLGKLLAKDDSVYQNLSETVAAFRNVATKLDKGESSLGKFVSDDGSAYRDLQSTLANLRAISERVEKGQGTLGKLMSADDKLYQDLSESVAHVKNVAARMDQGKGTLGRLLTDDGGMYTNLYAAADNLRVVTDRMAKGEGTLGRLTKDDKLYREAVGLIGDVRETVDNMRESTPLSTFSSILMGGL